jgi:hypothetical protein
MDPNLDRIEILDWIRGKMNAEAKTMIITDILSNGSAFLFSVSLRAIRPLFSRRGTIILNTSLSRLYFVCDRLPTVGDEHCEDVDEGAGCAEPRPPGE